MRNITKTVYTFDELSDAAKEKAADWYRQCINTEPVDTEYIIDDAVAIGAILGIAVEHRPIPLMNGSHRSRPVVYWDIGRDFGASFNGNYYYAKGCSRKIREYAPTDTDLHCIADELVALQAPTFYRLAAGIRASQRSMSLSIDVERTDGIEPTADQTDGIQTAVSAFAQWIAKAIEREDEYRNSDECVKESIEANGYEFDIDGRIVR